MPNIYEYYKYRGFPIKIRLIFIHNVNSQDADEDLKKHPTIVKNGGANGTTNGTSSEAPAEVELGKVENETTNINPELSTVTWTAEENNKTEADMHQAEAEQKPLKEETVENE